MSVMVMFPLSSWQGPEPAGRWDSGHTYGGNTLTVFIDMGRLILIVGGAILQLEALDLLNTFAFTPTLSLLWV